ncbi:MAG TPA: hypothetical protein VES19_11410 [Candidatus Limnocylindrales bacterium]|nr:hypothetical protein [Candidatus Limnocylindrales bacterium]
MHRLPSTRSAVRGLVLPIVAVALVAACGGGAGSPSPSSTPQPPPVDPTPVIPTPSPIADGTYWLRMTTWQAIPPVNLFAFTPTAVIDASGQLILPGAVPAIFPGPLVGPLFARQVSEAGRETIMSWAKELGLLAGKTDFTGDGGLPGGMTGRIELTVGGERITLSGLPDLAAPDPEPGSPQAFAELWRRIASLSETLPGELGPEGPYTPAGYALLVGAAPEPQDGLSGGIADWPLEESLATFGGPVANGTYRCGIVDGEDAVTLGAALGQANQLTQWTQDPTTSATFGLTVRPIVAGENPCVEVFGL